MQTTEELIEEGAADAYTAYCQTRKWKSYSGQDLPHWENVEEDIKVGWREAARAAFNCYRHWVITNLP